MFTYNVCLEKVSERSDQLFVTLYTLSIYPSVHSTHTADPNPFRSTHCIISSEQAREQDKRRGQLKSEPWVYCRDKKLNFNAFSLVSLIL